MKQVGLITPDERVYKMIALYMSSKLNEILEEVSHMEQADLKNTVTFETLKSSLDQFGVKIYRPPFSQEDKN